MTRGSVDGMFTKAWECMIASIWGELLSQRVFGFNLVDQVGNEIIFTQSGKQTGG